MGRSSPDETASLLSSSPAAPPASTKLPAGVACMYMSAGVDSMRITKTRPAYLAPHLSRDCHCCHRCLWKRRTQKSCLQSQHRNSLSAQTKGISTSFLSAHRKQQRYLAPHLARTHRCCHCHLMKRCLRRSCLQNRFRIYFSARTKDISFVFLGTQRRPAASTGTGHPRDCISI